MAGSTAAVDFIADIAPPGGSRRQRLAGAHHLIEENEVQLRRRIEEGLTVFRDRLTVHSVAADRTSTISHVPRKDVTDAYRILAAGDILAPAGTFYADEPFRALNLESTPGCEEGLAPDNDDTEVDRLLSAFEEFMSARRRSFVMDSALPDRINVLGAADPTASLHINA